MNVIKMSGNFVPREMLNGRPYETTFHMDFDIAEHFGITAVRDTFKRAFGEWKTDIKYVTELAIVMNVRCWYWYERGNSKLSEEYQKRFYQVQRWVYDEKCGFTQEDLNYYFEMTD